MLACFQTRPVFFIYINQQAANNTEKVPPPEDEDNGEYFVLSDEERARLEAMFAEMDDENYGAIPDLEDGKTEERKVSEDLSPSQESEAEVTTICSFKIS